MSRRFRAAAALALALAVQVAPAGGPLGGTRPVAAADVLGPATATSTFQVGIDLSEPATLPAGVTRLEALVRFGSHSFSHVTSLPLPSAGATTLHYRLDTPAGAVTPNTPVELRFRVTLADGTQILGPIARVRYQDTRFDWQTLSGDVVRVHWIEGGATFGRRALAIGEEAVADVSRLLGVTESEPIDFFIYPDQASFYDVLGRSTRENVGGIAYPDIRTLLADIGPDQVNDAWVGIVIPHELTHLVFATATDNPYHSPPHWLNEGIAVYFSQGYDSGHRADVSAAVRSDSIMPLTALEGQFPTTGDRFGLAYAESVAAIDYLVGTYGKPALVKLIQSYKAGVGDDEAFKAALGIDVVGFQGGWYGSLGIAAPKPFGPQPDPAGQVPPDWAGPGATPGTIAGPSASSVTGSPAPATPAPSRGGVPAGDSRPDGLLVALLALVIVIAAVGIPAVVIRRRRAPPLP